MRQQLHLSLNDNVKVKLTPRGVQRYIESYTELGCPPPSLPQPDSEGYTSFQLWTLMNTFGPATYMGMPLMFERNLVVIEWECK